MGKEGIKEGKQRKQSLYAQRGWPRALWTSCPEQCQAASAPTPPHTLQRAPLPMWVFSVQGPPTVLSWVGLARPWLSRSTKRSQWGPPPPTLGNQERAHMLQNRRLIHPCLYWRDAVRRGSAVGQPRRVIPYPALGRGTATGCPWKWPQGLCDVARTSHKGTEEARRTLLALLGEASFPTSAAGQLWEKLSRGRLRRQGARSLAPLNPGPGL